MLILISVLVGVAAFFGWMSSRVLKMPNTIGTMLLTAVSSISLVLLARVWPQPHDWALQIISQVNFERLILHGMLSLLLFAGASLLEPVHDLLRLGRSSRWLYADGRRRR